MLTGDFFRGTAAIVPNVVRRFFEEMSKKHNVDLDALNVHITNGQIYVQKYTPGHIDMFKLLEII